MHEALETYSNIVNSDIKRNYIKFYFSDDVDAPKRMGKLKSIDKFDSGFFSFNEQQAFLMDPQGRILLEKTYEAIADAGINIIFIINYYYIKLSKADEKHWLRHITEMGESLNNLKIQFPNFKIWNIIKQFFFLLIMQCTCK